jgi:putative phosphoribosyl transferase
MEPMEQFTLRIDAHGAALQADLSLPTRPRGLVLFAHGSGSSRLSPRNRLVAGRLNDARLATVLADLLTAEEEAIDERTRRIRFDIPLLAERLVGLTDWLKSDRRTADLVLGYFGASTGGAAALAAAAQRPYSVGAVVSRGGRPDLAEQALERVRAPTLLIVGGSDGAVIDLNRRALASLHGTKQLTIVPGATHLFEEPDALETVSFLARDWFLRHLNPSTRSTDELS